VSDAALAPAAALVQAALAALGSDARVREMPGSTRTAEDAAAACGCPVGAIVKSLVFRDAEAGSAVLVLTSGANRVHEKRLGARLGIRLERADADFVRKATGYAIGGVPPLGHPARLRTVFDPALNAFATVWAAAGTPVAVFPVAPADLARMARAEVVEVT
jgi:prolyl-tRNA editing enzyme YbaK/EbsC (Cys-tRNA(Pro) deacylase)